MKRLMILAILAMQVASVCAQQNDFYYAGVRSDTLAAVYKNNELLYTNFEEGNRWCWADCMVISNNGDVYYGGAGNSFGYVWKNGEMYFKGDAVSSETNALQETEKSPMVVFPNPVKDRATLECIDSAEIQLYNLQGQLVRTFSDTNEIDVSGLPEGIYLLQVTDREGLTHPTRLVVE